MDCQSSKRRQQLSQGVRREASGQQEFRCEQQLRRTLSGIKRNSRLYTGRAGQREGGGQPYWVGCCGLLPTVSMGGPHHPPPQASTVIPGCKLFNLKLALGRFHNRSQKYGESRKTKIIKKELQECNRAQDVCGPACSLR